MLNLVTALVLAAPVPVSLPATVDLGFSEAARLGSRVLDAQHPTLTTSISLALEQGGAPIDHARLGSEITFEVVVTVSDADALAAAGAGLTIRYGVERLGADRDVGDLELSSETWLPLVPGVTQYRFEEVRADLPLGVYRIAAWHEIGTKAGPIAGGYTIGAGVAPAAPDRRNMKRPDLVIGATEAEAEPSLTVEPVTLHGYPLPDEVLPEGVVRSEDSAGQLTVKVTLSEAAASAPGRLHVVIGRDLQGGLPKDDETDETNKGLALDGSLSYELTLPVNTLRPGVHQLAALVTLRDSEGSARAEATSPWHPIFVMDGVPPITVCGNLLREGKESCDGAVAPEDSCATASGYGEGATGELLCNVDCSLDTSQCKPPPSVCGNGRTEKGEACDGNPDEACVGFGLGDGMARCVDCQWNLDACGPVEFCGDGVVQAARGETCDGAVPAGPTCASVTGVPYMGGALTCTPDCQISAAGCTTCGNGIVDPGEKCDGPTGLQCVTNIGAATCWDNCQGFSTSGGCMVVPSSYGSCGNGVRNYGELCDGADLGGVSCAYLGVAGDGPLTCSWNCTFDSSTCMVEPTCPNGEIDPGEDCDGADLRGQTCVSRTGRDGTLACSATCSFDESDCTESLCGNGALDDGEPCDGPHMSEGLDCETATWVPGMIGSLGCTSLCTLDTSACTTCGNRDLDVGEECDASTGELGDETCVSRTGLDGVLTCSDACTFDESDCTETLCGNGALDEGEQCDGAVSSDLDCEEVTGVLGQIGTLACTSDCTLDTSGCTTCGNGVIDGAEPCDGTVPSWLGCEGATKIACSFGPLTCTSDCQLDTSACTTCSDGELCEEDSACTWSWEAMADAPNTATSGGIAYDGADTIYVLRGSRTKDFWGYSITSNAWSILAETPELAGDSADYGYNNLLAHDSASDHIYALQGYAHCYTETGGNCSSSQFWRYSPTDDAWTIMAPYPSLAYPGSGIAYVDGSIYLIGGGRFSGVDNAFWRYAISDDSWEFLGGAPGQISTYSQAPLVYPGHGDFIYALGEYAYGRNDRPTWRYSMTNDSWDTTTVPGSGLTHWDGHRATSDLGNWIYAVGGAAGCTRRYAIADNTWHALPSSPTDSNTGAGLVYTSSGIFLLPAGGFGTDFLRLTATGCDPTSVP